MRDLAQTLNALHSKYVERDFIQAELGVREAIQTWPDQPDVLRLGALTALALNQLVAADQRLGRATELVPMTAEMANTNGNIRAASADWAESEAAYNEALELDENYALAQMNLLNLFIKSGQPRRALKLLENGPDFAEFGELARVQIFNTLGRYDEALSLIKGLNHNQYAEQFLLQKVKSLAILGRLDEMMAAFDGFDEGSLLISEALSICVNALMMRGQREAALDLIAKVSVSDETPPAALVSASQILRRQDENELSKAVLRTASQRFSPNASILNEQGYAALNNGKADEAFELFTDSLKTLPANLNGLLGRARAAIVSRKYEDAQATIQAALSQAPNNQYIMALGATLQRATGQNHKMLYNYDKFVRVYDLEPPTGYSDMAAFNARLKEELDALHVYSETPINQSVRGGTQTETDLAHSDNPVIRSFFDAVDAPIRNYIQSIGKNPHHPLMNRARENYRISGAWSIRLSEEGHHVNHVHPMGWISSAYYVDVPPSVNDTSREGWIQFGEPNLEVGLEAEHFVQPKAGRLVLFPSYMWHGTIPFKGAETRLTLPFDVVPA